MPTDTEMLDWMAAHEADICEMYDPVDRIALAWVGDDGHGRELRAPDIRSAVAQAMEAK